MAIDLPTLSTEVKLAKYAGMDQTAIAAGLNARVIPGDVDVSVLAIDRYLSVNGIWGKIDARCDYYRAKLASAALNSADEQKLANLRTMVRALEKLPDFQTSVNANKVAIFALIENLYLPIDATPTAGEGLITITQRNQLRQLVTGNISRVEQMFARGDRVTPEQVEQARRL